MYLNEKRDEMEKLNDLASLQNHVKTLRLHEILGNQNFHADTKKIEPVTKTIKTAPEEVTKTTMVSSEENNKAIAVLTKKF